MNNCYSRHILKKILFIFVVLCSSLYADTSSKLLHKSFYFIRHGETEWNKLNKPMGKKDIPLNDTGKKQAEEISKFLVLMNFKAIAASPLKRALDTARIVNQKTSLPLKAYDGLMERDVFEQKNEKGETVYVYEDWSTFKNRVLETMNHILETTEEPVLIVAHGGVFSALTDLVGEATFYVKNCEPFYFNAPKSAGEKWQIYRLFTKLDKNNVVPFAVSK
jgi:broad specificity phosphatase PhoE